MTFDAAIRQVLKSGRGLDIELWDLLPKWQKKALLATYDDLEGLSNKFFNERKALVRNDFTMPSAALSLRFSRTDSTYHDELKNILVEHNSQTRLTALKNVANSLNVSLPRDFSLSPNTGAVVLSQSETSSDSMVNTYDSRLSSTIKRASEDAENEGVTEGEDLAEWLWAAILLWHTTFSPQQSLLTSETEFGRSYNGQWKVFFDDNNFVFRERTLVRVVPEFSNAVRDSEPICAEVVADNPYTLEGLENIGYPPFHKGCIHTVEFESIEGVEGQRVNLDGRVFEL